MAFATVVLYVLIVFVRPAEIVASWDGLPFAMITQILAAVAVGLSLLMNPPRRWIQPHDKYVAGFFIAAVLSNPAWGWFGGAWPTFVELLPVMLAYPLIRGVVRTERQLRWMGHTFLVLTLFQAVNGIVQFRTGVGLGNVAAIEQQTTVQGDEGAETTEVRRIQGTGIFNDPNDLAMAFVTVLPLAIGPIVSSRVRLRVRIAAAIFAAPFVGALVFTNSRGGIMGFGAELIPYCFRFGKILGAIVAAIGFTALIAFGPSRMDEMSSDDGSAQGRMHSWSAGLQMLKARPVLGVGYGRYLDYSDLVAHNSFVHVLGELGLVGGFFFAGMMYWLFKGFGSTAVQPSDSPQVARFRRWGSDLRNGSLGMLVCAMFLSRQYIVVLFMWVAMGASYRHVAETLGDRPAAEDRRDPVAIAAATVAGIITVWIFVRVFAVFGGG